MIRLNSGLVADAALKCRARVLLVEDDKEHQDGIRSYLTQRG